MVWTANEPQWKVVVKYFLISLKYFSFVSQLFLYFFHNTERSPGLWQCTHNTGTATQEDDVI